MSREWRTYLADIATACEIAINNNSVRDVVETKVPELLLAVEAFQNENPVDP